MKSILSIKTILTVLFSLVIATFFMWLAFKGLDFNKIQNYFLIVDYFWIFFATLFGILAYWFRAIRWNILLEPLGYRISNSNSLWAISFGYLLNLTIPRSGELARATALYRVEKVPIDRSFGTVILERIVDLVCMLAFLSLTLIFKYNAIKSFYIKSGMKINPYYAFGVLIILVIGVLMFYKLKNNFINLPFIGKVISTIEGILSGLLSIFKLKQKGKFALYSIAIWICYYLSAYLVCFALPETSSFSITDGFFIIVVGTLGMMVPASGGIGAFHFALKMGVGALFFSIGKSFEKGTEVGLAYAFISHTLQLAIMAVMGFISIPILAKNKTLS